MNWVSVRAKPASARGGKAPKAIYDAALWRRATIEFPAQVRSADPGPKSGHVRGLAWCRRHCRSHDQSCAVRAKRRVGYLQRRRNGDFVVHRLVREFCGGAGGMPGQGEGCVAAANQGGTDGQPRESLGRRLRPFLHPRCARAMWCGLSATSSFPRTARFSKALRLSMNRPLPANPLRCEAARDGHVFDRHGGDAADFRSAGCSCDRRSR